jgi:hypothetical protein
MSLGYSALPAAIDAIELIGANKAKYRNLFSSDNMSEHPRANGALSDALHGC